MNRTVGMGGLDTARDVAFMCAGGIHGSIHFGGDPINYDVFLQSIVALHREAVGRAAALVNQSLIFRNGLIGADLVELEQTGEDRAAYGERFLERISGDLKELGVRGLGISTLRNCRLAGSDE